MGVDNNNNKENCEWKIEYTKDDEIEVTAATIERVKEVLQKAQQNMIKREIENQKWLVHHESLDR